MNETNEPRAELPRWQCHKVVRAAKVMSIAYERANGAGAAILEVAVRYVADSATDRFKFDEQEAPTGRATVTVGEEYVRKHNPNVGGYYVRYEDGYESFSPAAAFEAGYSLL